MPSPASKNESYVLLDNTFQPAPDETKLSANVMAFARVYDAIDRGHLTVNGLPPDKNYKLAEYLIYGGRIKFDLSELDNEERDTFFKYVVYDVTTPKPRPAASHRHDGIDANGNIREIKAPFTGWLFKKHYGIDLPIGGNKGTYHRDDQSYTICEDGQWGHMYIYDDHMNGFMMFGVENSAPLKRNIRTNQTHSIFSTSNPISAFNVTKLGGKKKLAPGEVCPLTINSYNWACVKITREHLKHIQDTPLLLDDDTQRKTFIERLKQPPKTAIEIKNPAERFEQMKKFQNATRVKNSHTERWLFGGGIFLTIVGLFLTFSPFPPGVSQAIGSALTLKGAAMMMTVPTIMGFVASLARTLQVYRIEKKWNEVKQIISYNSQIVSPKEEKPELDKQILDEHKSQPVPVVNPVILQQPQSTPNTKFVYEQLNIPPLTLLSRSLPISNFQSNPVSSYEPKLSSLPFSLPTTLCSQEVIAAKESFANSPMIGVC